MVMYDNEFETKENKIQTKEKIRPQFQYGEGGGGKNNVVVTKKKNYFDLF